MWAGGGRYLVLHLQNPQLAIYDVNAAKVTRYLSLGSDNALIAGGLDKLIVVAPGESLIERWSLQSFEKETAQRLPIKGIVKNAALGYASHGPLLLHAAASTDQLAAAGPALLKLTNFEEIKVKGFNSHNGSFRDHVHIRASGTGDVFGSWCTSHSPQGLEVAVLMGDTVKMAYQHDSVGHVVPNFDGSAVLTGIAGVFTPELTNKRERIQGMMPGIPSTHPRFYVSVPTEPAAQRNLGGQPFAGRKAAVHVLGLDAAIVDLPDLGLGQPAENYSWSANDFTLDKRVMFVPQANQVVSIPYTNDRLIVQRFNVIEALDAAKVDYLFVRSTPPRTFKKIEMYRYEIEVASRAGGVQYELSSGPPGMELSSAGVLQWKPPLDFAESNVSVIVTIKNAQGQSVYDSFTLNAQSAPNTERQLLT